MKVTVEELTPIRKKLKIELPHSDYEEALEKAYQKLGKKVNIKGFRKGKVPRSILEKYYGTQTQMETISHLVDDSYQKAIHEQGIPAVDMPKISDLKVEAEHPITYVAEVEVQPKIDVKDVSGIPLKKEKVEVSSEEIEGELKNLQKAQGQLAPVEEGEEAQAGHLATLSYSGRVDGVPFEGGSAQNVALELGAGRFLPDFEQGVLGMKKGEKREVSVRFPNNYPHPPLQGKTASFEIELHELKKVVLPELDDEFAKDLGKFESLEQLKGEIRDRLQKGKETQQRGDIFRQILDHLLAKNPFEIPEAMVTRELDYMVKTVQEQLKQQGMSLEQAGMSEQDYRTKNREEAIRRVKGFLLFDGIAVQNNLLVAETEIETRLSEMARQFKQPVEAVKKYYIDKGLIRPLYNQILEEKILDFVISKAKIEEKKK